MSDSQLQDYDQFLAQFPLRQYPKGTILISPNEELERIFFLDSGLVRKYDVTKYHDQVVMNVFKAPILFPLSWALNKTPNKYYFEAVTPLKARSIPIDAVVEYLKTNPHTAYDLLRQVYAGLEDTQRRVVYLTRGGLRSRLLFELLVEARRAGEMQDDGSFIVTISTTELALRSGLSRETISRELTKIFRRNEVCRRQGRSIVIQDLQKLDELLRATI